MDPGQELVNQSDIPPIVVMKPQRETTDSDLRLTALHTAAQRTDPRDGPDALVEVARKLYGFLAGVAPIDEMMGAGTPGKGTPYL